MSASVHLQTKSGLHWWTYEDIWIDILDAARKEGWEPAGTVLYPWDFDQPTHNHESIPTWNGKYGPAEGQVITAQDAKNIAAALRRYVAHGQDEPGWDRDDTDYLLTLIAVLESGEDVHMF